MKSRLPDGFRKQSVSAMLENAQKIQAEVGKMKEEMAQMEFCAASGDDSIAVIVGGDKKVKELKISKKIVSDNDLEMLQDLLVVTVNNAFEKASDYYDEKMSAITGDLNIPSL